MYLYLRLDSVALDSMRFTKLRQGQTDSLKILSLLLNRCSIIEASPSLSLRTAPGRSLAGMEHLLALDHTFISKEVPIEISWNT
ncbi:hypothetical protein BDV26DRAFT_81388 [Aspergillus bertholletiae]|uniref:Uncharacterized protein n=1 Tax=Aspergillus bertholletiae TaxID=1226010 RepID=A0A5N7AVM0_9EURO|nr:hypothetical protein BDV26DRAFT_81388 [Aspergillus bertholletiae]